MSISPPRFFALLTHGDSCSTSSFNRLRLYFVRLSSEVSIRLLDASRSGLKCDCLQREVIHHFIPVAASKMLRRGGEFTPFESQPSVKRQIDVIGCARVERDFKPPISFKPGTLEPFFSHR